jgi:polar amino acid transport system substrate-binding protein
MKRSFYLAIALALALPSGLASAQSAKLPDLKGATIVAVTENAFTPLNFVDPKTGKGIGWEYDAVNEIARRLNAKVSWKLCSWDTMIQAIRDGQFDVGMDGISITDERKGQVDFSQPYMVARQYMLVRAKESRFSDPASFKANPKLLVGAQAGTTNFYTAVYDVLQSDEKDPRVKLFETFGASVQALKAGDVDMVLMDAASSKGFIGANPGLYKTVGDPIGSDAYGFIFKKGSKFVAPFDAALAAMKADGTLDKLSYKWFVDYKP